MSHSTHTHTTHTVMSCVWVYRDLIHASFCIWVCVVCVCVECNIWINYMCHKWVMMIMQNNVLPIYTLYAHICKMTHEWDAWCIHVKLDPHTHHTHCNVMCVCVTWPIRKWNDSHTHHIHSQTIASILRGYARGWGSHVTFDFARVILV